MPRPALLLALTLGAAPAVPAQDVAVLVRRLNDPDAQARASAYRALLSVRPGAALKPLEEQLPRFGFYGRNYGAILLSRYPIKRTRPVLRKLVDSGVPFLELTSAVTLAQAGDEEYIDRAVAALGRPGVAVMTKATMLRRVKPLRSPKVLAAVCELLVPGVHVSILTAGLEYLADAAEGDTRVAGAIDAMLRAPATTGITRAICAAFAVSRGRTQHAAGLADAIAKMPAIPTSLWPYLERIQEPGKPVLDGLARHVAGTKNADSFGKAVDFLVRHDHAGLAPTLRTVARTAPQAIAQIAWRRLAELPGQLKNRELVGLLDAKPAWLNLFAAETLLSRDDEAGLAKTLELTARQGPHTAEAIRVLSAFRSDQVVVPLIEALDHDSPAVRRAALTAVTTVLRRLFPYRRFDLRKAGYSVDADKARRQQAVRTIKVWWASHRR